MAFRQIFGLALFAEIASACIRLVTNVRPLYRWDDLAFVTMLAFAVSPLGQSCFVGLRDRLAGLLK